MVVAQPGLEEVQGRRSKKLIKINVLRALKGRVGVLCFEF